MSDFSDSFGALLRGHQPRPARPQVEGLQEATILDVFASTATFTNVAGFPGKMFGPAPFARGAAPEPGDACLVVFVGTGVDRPWILLSRAPD